MPELIAPTGRLHPSWLAARDEWTPGGPQDGTREGRVHATHWWIVEDDTYLGAIDLRHYLNAFLLDVGGHIGYSVRPSFRRRGLATWALGAVLPEARALGLDRVLVTCDDDNIGSARGIERNGGVLEDVRTTDAGGKRRYWITL
ncbi:GNAT family N-acetyltransferase [Streptomyces sp. NPDC006700]|uniref:GNAT family N-acetyltransferase n=1 Tax=unclassified Streptomyces TaxID=2593676 RepID=UPI0033D4119C